jgi:hypothetical protein
VCAEQLEMLPVPQNNGERRETAQGVQSMKSNSGLWQDNPQ